VFREVYVLHLLPLHHVHINFPNDCTVASIVTVDEQPDILLLAKKRAASGASSSSSSSSRVSSVNERISRGIRATFVGNALVLLHQRTMPPSLHAQFISITHTYTPLRTIIKISNRFIPCNYYRRTMYTGHRVKQVTNYRC